MIFNWISPPNPKPHSMTCVIPWGKNDATHSHARSIAHAWLKHAHSFDRCGGGRIDCPWWIGLKVVAGNAMFLRNQKGDANNVDVPHTLSEMTMARSKIWMILDKTRTNAWWDNMVNNSIASGKKTSDCLNLPLGYFLKAFCFSLPRHQTAC